MVKNDQGKPQILELLSPCDIPLVRYIKIRGISNPYSLDDAAYFAIRRKAKNYHPLKANKQTAGFLLKEGLLGA
jgi:hypothetical protein